MTIDRTDAQTGLGRRPIPAENYTKEETYGQTRLPVELATTLIPDAYTSQDFYDIEQEKVFAASWVVVGCTSQVEEPGQAIVAEVAGRSVIVARSGEGELRAFHNVCRHRAAKLLDEGCASVRSNRIRCPYHSWTFDLEGNCLGTPLFEGSDIPEEARSAFDTSGATRFDKADYGLLPVRVESWGFLVFVNLDPDASPLSEHLGDLPRRLGGHRLEEWRVARSKDYDVAANHKLVSENFLEYYHLPWVHPELVKVSRMDDHYRWQGPGMYVGLCTTPISRDTDTGGFDGLPPLSTIEGDDAVSARFALIFPSTAIAVLPNHAFVIIARPAGPGRTLERTFVLSHPESMAAPDADVGLDKLMGFWNVVNSQDIEVIERVQEGLSNPEYRGGRMCYRFEETLHRLQNMFIDWMVGVDRVPPGDEAESVPMFEDQPSGIDWRI